MKMVFKYLLILLFSHSVIFADILGNKKDASSALNSYLENLESFDANFQQQIVSSSRRLMDTASGRFIMKRPGRFRWQTMTPYEQLIIADGKTVWTIDDDLEQVNVNDYDQNIVNSPMMLLSQKNKDINEFFTVQTLALESEHEAESDSKMQRFLLLPIDSSSNFEKIQLGFKEGILYLLELHDSLGQITIITMLNVRNNPIISDDLFVYKEIPDYDVIDFRAQETTSDGN
ncbi:MAG: outer membrane lipoprotein chaperone LolA [Gammaproteobacteria bacterium]|nr:outer membrane lipoprotein chaperone LolA [Gammaproteobacteria bacterium]